MNGVIVIGAGPSGLAVACGLLQQGVPVRVLDRADRPALTSRANILHARGVEVLDRLGALADLRDRAVTVMSVTMHVGGRPVTTIRIGAEAGRAEAALVASQAEVEARLRDRLTELGGRVEWGTELVDLAQTRDGVTVTLADGRTAAAGWVLGCDGAHSAVRRLAGIGFPGVPSPEQFLLADAHLDWDVHREGTAGWYAEDGVLLAMPMRDPDGREDRWRLMANVDLTEPRPPTERALLDRLQELIATRAGRSDGAIREAVWTSVFRIQRRLAEDYRRGRVLLVGDAAHIHSPMGGQGMNTGIGDAENLAWKLGLVVAGRAGDGLLDTYATERRPLAAEVLRGADAATRLQVGAGPVGRFVRDRVMVPVLGLPAVQRWLTGRASQLWVSYRRGPLGGGRRQPGRGLRPGDRVPDRRGVLLDAAHSSPSRMYSALRSGWALLDPGDGLCDVAEKHLGRPVVALRAGEPRAMLVRPDGHLAWSGAPTDVAGLKRWLDSALHRGRAS
ncbi:MAG: FAD-dependent monooxygenase [Pseudonocardia sp.]|nr:FAD-dependent monooxygenase [Pseudonocardia sp.]